MLFWLSSTAIEERSPSSQSAEGLALRFPPSEKRPRSRAQILIINGTLLPNLSLLLTIFGNWQDQQDELADQLKGSCT